MKKTVLRNDRAFDELKSELYKRLNRISDQSARDNLWEIISYITNNYSGSPSNPYIADIDNELLFSVQIGSFLPPVLSCFRFKYFGIRYFGIGGQLRL